MSKKTTLWLISAVLLIVIGGIGFTAVMADSSWDLNDLSTTEYETNEYAITDAFQSISITTDTADITFLPSDDTTASVVCYEQETMRHQVSVKDGILVIEVIDTRKWYEYIGIFLGKPKITLCIPQVEYDSLTISTATGDIHLEDLTAEELDLAVSTGKVTLSNVVSQGDIRVHVSTGKTNLTNIQCKNLISNGSTGDIVLQNVIATEAFSIGRDTGDVKFDSCDAAEISVETDTGDVTGSLKTEKIILAETDTGKIRVPNAATGGKCKIQTDTGDIVIRIDQS